MFVFKDKTLYVKDGQVLQYGYLADALFSARGFGGYAYIAEDIDSL